jgi:hypothetical protein
MNEHTCLVCGYSDDIEFYPRDYSICSCCGTEFGFDDRVLTHEQLREAWISHGYPWFYANEPQPIDWDPYAQLVNAGLIGARTALGATSAHGGPSAREFAWNDIASYRLIRLAHRAVERVDVTSRELQLVDA